MIIFCQKIHFCGEFYCLGVDFTVWIIGSQFSSTYENAAKPFVAFSLLAHVDLPLRWQILHANLTYLIASATYDPHEAFQSSVSVFYLAETIVTETVAHQDEKICAKTNPAT